MELSNVADGNVKWYNPFGELFIIKLNMYLPCDSAVPLWCLSKRSEDMCSYNDSYENVCSNLIMIVPN